MYSILIFGEKEQHNFIQNHQLEEYIFKQEMQEI